MISVFICVVAPNIEKIGKQFCDNIFILLRELPDYNIGDLAARASFMKLFPELEEALVFDIESALLSKIEDRYSDALNATIVLIRQNNERIGRIVLLISQRIEFRSTVCLDKSLSIFYTIVKMHAQYLNDDIIKNLNTGLSHLLDETTIKDNDDIEDIHKKTKYRMEGNKLLCLFKKYYRENNYKIPSYMKAWEESCLDENEFSEVRNSWLNNM
jgi:hypothetical protein